MQQVGRACQGMVLNLHPNRRPSNWLSAGAGRRVTRIGNRIDGQLTPIS